MLTVFNTEYQKIDEFCLKLEMVYLHLIIVLATNLRFSRKQNQ